MTAANDSAKPKEPRRMTTIPKGYRVAIGEGDVGVLVPKRRTTRARPTRRKAREWHIWNDSANGYAYAPPEWRAHKWYGKNMDCYGCIRVREVLPRKRAARKRAAKGKA